MDEPIKRLASVEKRAVYTAPVIHVVVNCLLEAVDRVGGGMSPFKTELVRRCIQMFRKQTLQNMLKYLCQHRRDGDAAIIIDITRITLSVLDNRDYVPKSELFRYKRVKKHAVDKLSQS